MAQRQNNEARAGAWGRVGRYLDRLARPMDFIALPVGFLLVALALPLGLGVGGLADWLYHLSARGSLTQRQWLGLTLALVYCLLRFLVRMGRQERAAQAEGGSRPQPGDS